MLDTRSNTFSRSISRRQRHRPAPARRARQLLRVAAGALRSRLPPRCRAPPPCPGVAGPRSERGDFRRRRRRGDRSGPGVAGEAASLGAADVVGAAAGETDRCDADLFGAMQTARAHSLFYRAVAAGGRALLPTRQDAVARRCHPARVRGLPQRHQQRQRRQRHYRGLCWACVVHHGARSVLRCSGDHEDGTARVRQRAQ
jgi:hypothetical protein